MMKAKTRMKIEKMTKQERTAALVLFGCFAGEQVLYMLGDKAFRSTVSSRTEWSYGKGGKKGKAGEPSKEERLRSEFGPYYDAQVSGMEWIDARIPDPDRERKAAEPDDAFEDVWIRTTAEGLDLHGYYYHARDPKRIVLLAHGYRNNIRQFAGIAPWLAENGCDLLLIEQRGCGKSGGDWITYGALEKLDVLDWVSWLHDHNSNGLPVYLYGVSMGASTILCASAYDYSNDVRGIIADAGFTGMREVTILYFRKWYPMLPARLMVRMIGDRCRSQAGFDMDDTNTEKALAFCKLPVLFIHGTADDFVPPEHTERNYAACACPDKRILWVEGAGHVRSWFRDPERYRAALTDFFAGHDAGAGLEGGTDHD